MKKILLSLLLLLSLRGANYAQVVINEVMIMPGTTYSTSLGADNTNANLQSMINGSNTGQEWIELYNTNGCDSADISCYIIGSNTADGSNYAAYSFPAGTKIPPHGFLTIGAGTGVDINLYDVRLTNNLCYNTRWHMTNGNGYVALYSPTGTAVNAVYWAANAASLSSATEYDNVLCVPGGSCTPPAYLGMANEITGIEYAGDAASSAVGATTIGKTISRSSDGGNSWVIANPTQGTCNGACLPTGLSISLTIATTSTTCGQDTGSAIITVTSGTGPFTYSLNGNTATSDSIFTNLQAGNYSLQIQAAGCTKDTTFTIVGLGSQTTIDSLVILEPSCTSPGSILVYASPSPGLTYSLNNGTPQSDSLFTSLSAGTYQLTVSDSGCTKDTSITLSLNNLLQLDSINIVPASCGTSTGSAQVYASGENNITYSLNNGTAVTSNLFDSLPAASYTLSVIAGSCRIDSVVTIGSVGQLSANVNTEANCGEPCNYTGPKIMINEVMLQPSVNDGSIYGETSLSGKEGEWIELFNPDKCNPVDISCYILGNYDDTQALLPPPDRTNGAAFVLPQGTVVPPLGFVIVRGRNAPAPPSGTIDIVVDNIANRLCIDGGLNDSRMWFKNAGGWFAFYDKDGNAVDAIKWGAPTANALNGNPCTPGAACVPSGTVLPSATAMGSLVTDLGTTPGNDIAFVRIPDGGSWSTSGQAPTYGTCNSTCVPPNSGTCNGTATINVSGGSGNYTYTWNTGNTGTANGNNITGLCEGSYSVTVNGGVGCSNTFSFTINKAPVIIDVVASPLPSCNAANGVLTVYAQTNGNSITYQLNNNAAQADSVFTGIGAGSYTITLLSGACTVDTLVQVTTTNALSIVNLNQVKPEYCDKQNAIIQVQTNGGTAPLTFATNGLSPQADSSISNLSAGTYTVNVTDANGCKDSANITVTEIQAPVLSANQIKNATCGNTNGEITVVSQNGTSPYVYSINGGTFTNLNTFLALGANNYQIIVSDSAGCRDTVNIPLLNLSGPTQVIASVTNEHCDQADATISIAVAGGNAPYQYSIDNGATYLNSSSFTNLPAGNYTILVKDSNNCTLDTAANIAESTIAVELSADLYYSETIPQAINLTTTNINNALYSWNFGNGQTASGNTPTTSVTYAEGGEYLSEVIVTDEFGCVASDTVRIIIASLDLPNVFTPNSDGTNDNFILKNTGYKNLNCLIYNRWGQLLYEFNAINQGWNGKNQSGTDVPEGTYFYILKVETLNGQSKEFSGYITLTR